MATINEITNAASYRGDAALGGAGEIGLNIDWRPMQQLAQYTFMYNRSEYEQRQKDADEKIDELAKLTAYDAATGEGKDKDEVLDRLAKLKEKGAKFAGTVWDNPNDKTKAYFQFQKEIADDIKVLNSATARQTKLQLYNSTVDKDIKLSAAEKEVRKKQAQRIFDETDINTQFSIPDYDNTVPKTETPIYENNNVIIQTPDGMIDASIKQFSLSANDKASFLEGNDLMLTPPPENATQGEKDAFEQKKLAFGKTGAGAWVNAAQFWNAAIDNPNYKKTVTTNGINVMGEPPVTQLTNEIDIEKIKSENPIARDVVSLAERYNKYANDRIEAINKGYFIDNVTGLKVQFKNTDKVEDIPLIDVTKPISPKNLALLHRFESAEPDKIDKKYTYTGNKTKIDLEKMQQAGQTKREQIQQAGANYRAKLPYIMAKIGTGTATKEELSDYPILKTQELIETIGTDGKVKNFTELTPEQQAKLTIQVGDGITDMATAKISIQNGVIKITGLKDKKEAAISIIPDDITKDYYNEVNKNDAGKEAVKRQYFKYGDVKVDAAEPGGKAVSDKQYQEFLKQNGLK